MSVVVAGRELDTWMVALPVALAAGGAAVGLTYWIAGSGLDVRAPANIGIPFAEGIRRPAWPVLSANPRYGEVAYRDVAGDSHGNPSRRFGAARDGGSRNHVGVDLYADYGDPVLSMGRGTVVATQTFHLGSHAILVDYGDVVVLYGEVTPWSWDEFGVDVGSKVGKGDPIARVACMKWEGGVCKSHMLHLETYVAGSSRNRRWYPGNPDPTILDPSLLLLRAQQRA